MSHCSFPSTCTPAVGTHIQHSLLLVLTPSLLLQQVFTRCAFLLLCFLFSAKPSFNITDMDGTNNPTGAVDAFVCVISGAIGGLIIGLVTEYYTSHSYAPVREVRHGTRGLFV